jgi:hypothetical protein
MEMATRGLAPKLIVGIFLLSPLIWAEGVLEMEQRAGDWVVEGVETVEGRHIVIDGNIVLQEGAVLTLTDCVVEITGYASREHFVDFKGGRLVTSRTTIGGSAISGAPVHTVFYLYDGEWTATDTTIQYSYGVEFSDETPGVFHATRLKAGIRPDAVIVSGKGDVTLIDSDFPIAIAIYAHKGGKVELNLPINRAITRVFDASNLTPGVEWRLDMKNSSASLWFVFLRNISKGNPPCEVTLGECPYLIVSLFLYDIAGEFVLSGDLNEPAQLGSTTLKSAGKPLSIRMWALYFSGGKTDVTVRGPANVCEVMQWAGKSRFIGTPGKNDLTLFCTTLDLHGAAEMEIENVFLGRPLDRPSDGTIGEATVRDDAKLTGRNVVARDMRFHTKGEGTILIEGLEKVGKIETRQEGGKATLSGE